VARLATSPGTLWPARVLAAALPLLFLHVDYQPSVELGRAGIELSDLALLALFGTAIATGSLRDLRPGRALYALAAGLLAWIGLSVLLATWSEREYDVGTHAVSAAGFAEYTLLAAALPLLARGRTRLFAWTLGSVAAAAALVALLQFAGVDIFGGAGAGRRQPSFVGFHDLAALAGGVLALGVAAIALGPLPRRLVVLLCAGGAVGLALSASVAGGAGVLAATVLVLLVAARRGELTRRRLATVAALVGATLITIVGVRGGDLSQFARFAGLLPEERTTVDDVQTYSHRTLLVYLGWEVFLDHPVSGAGWHATEEYATLEPHLPAARRTFPDLAEQAFPTPSLPYGVQNGWVQSLSDLGLVGFLLFGATLLVPVAFGARRALRAAEPYDALAGAAALLVAAGVWTAQGLVAASPLEAVTFLGLGLVVAGLHENGERELVR
jgi:O-antigen ligase